MGIRQGPQNSRGGSLDLGSKVLGFECWVSGLGFEARFYDLGFRVEGSSPNMIGGFK